MASPNTASSAIHTAGWYAIQPIHLLLRSRGNTPPASCSHKKTTKQRERAPTSSLRARSAFLSHTHRDVALVLIGPYTFVCSVFFILNIIYYCCDSPSSSSSCKPSLCCCDFRLFFTALCCDVVTTCLPPNEEKIHYPHTQTHTRPLCSL